MWLSNFGRVPGRRLRPAKPFPILPSLRQAGSRSLPQNLGFELGEDRQQAGHCATGWRGQIQCLG
jgi:hypothetical protein